ncbi:MAG: nucleoside triphosphate pyrophosphohydrolase [Actinobacteria bacterium]|nr:nucleoside triphosphate pyrophosphohydrolase [Actinomycetota bacterium]
MASSRSADRPIVEVVGVGPGDARYATAATLEVIARHRHRYLRTAVHPSAHLVDNAFSFDDFYDDADSFEEVYRRIVEHLASEAREHGEILYAVPGSPLVLEETVAELRRRPELDVRVHPATGFLDLAWSALGIDPVEAGVTLIDGHRFASAAAGLHGPLLVAHTHAAWVLSDIKLSVDHDADSDIDRPVDDLPVTLLMSLGTEAERLVETTWSEMDRVEGIDHLTSLWVPHLGVPVAAGYQRFHLLARTLREQCPWDIEQTHRSLVPYLIEEAYEVVDAIEGLDPDDPASDVELIGELGDLLYQIEFHATIAEQEGRFTIADVTSAVHDKLVRRHPHVFGDTVVTDADSVTANWERLKRAERSPEASVFDGVPGSLPALSLADTVQRKAAKVGFDWPEVDGALAKVGEEAAEVVAARGDDEAVRDEMGDLLFAVVNVARHLGVDPESALRAAVAKFRRRFDVVDTLARERGIDLATSGLDMLDALWDEAKGRPAG